MGPKNTKTNTVHPLQLNNQVWLCENFIVFSCLTYNKEKLYFLSLSRRQLWLSMNIIVTQTQNPSPPLKNNNLNTFFLFSSSSLYFFKRKSGRPADFIKSCIKAYSVHNGRKVALFRNNRGKFVNAIIKVEWRD